MALQLTLAAAALDLLHRLDQLRGAAGHAGLSEAQLAAVGVEREVALPGEVVVGDEPRPVPFAQKPASSSVSSTVMV